MDDILVSVVIPTYGRTDFLEDAIESVENQTYKNIEIIICDDNALKPDVRNKVIEIVNNHKHCNLVLNNRNLGGALNRNEGIKASKGQLISFLDDDDVYLPQRIEKVVKLYLDNIDKKIGIIYTHCYTCDSKKRITGAFRINPTNNPLFRHMCGCLCATSQWTVPKNVFSEVGMFEDAECKQDSIMLLKILGSDYVTLCVQEPLSCFRDHSQDRISTNFAKHLRGEENLYKMYDNYWSKLTDNEKCIVEFCYTRTLLSCYSGMNKRKQALNCFVAMCKSKASLSINYRDILYLVASPDFYSKIKKSIYKVVLDFKSLGRK